MYKIECSKEQVEVLQKALELWARLSMGQFDEALTPFRYRNLPNENYFKEILNHLESKFSEKRIEGEHRDLSWEMYQTIRHRLSWDKAGNPPERDWKTMLTVNYDEPLKITQIPLLTIEKIST